MADIIIIGTIARYTISRSLLHGKMLAILLNVGNDTAVNRFHQLQALGFHIAIFGP
jgi:hypothetical protein